MTPRATYRLQFNREFPFSAAQDIVPYLDDLGISHIYASPITTAVPGSPHGYDVIDPKSVNPELGGEDGLRGLVKALRARGMGLIIDIVPNHMGVANGHNPYWNDVLRDGASSEYAHWFDIDWRQPILLPVLGAPLEKALGAGDIRIDRSESEPALLLYGSHRIPLRSDRLADLPPTDDPQALAALLDKQHYRLGWWRQANDELNWRRFFTINELAGLRVEDDDVFEQTHALYFRLWQQGLIDGVRVDHVDGLSDPAAYCRKLRKSFAALPRDKGAAQEPAYIVVEKILAPGEALPDDWGVDGTSGYDFMEDVSAVLHDPKGGDDLQRLWHDFSGRSLSFEEEELQARQDMLSWAFDGQLGACTEAFARLARSTPEACGWAPAMIRRAISRLLWVFPVYRTYGTGSGAPDEDAAIREQVRQGAARFTPPGEAEVSDYILRCLAGECDGNADAAAEAVRRFQQLSAPIAAKAVEDTAFYRYAPLLSRQDVGFDAGMMASSIGQFHEACSSRLQHFPRAMLATATHDHKRGEDVRARLAVLSAIPQVWRHEVTRWDEIARGASSGVAPADRYALYQMAFGCWPEDLAPDDSAGLKAYAQRLIAWQEKALREGKLRSSWVMPDEPYEAAAAAFAERLLDPEGAGSCTASIHAFISRTDAATNANILAQAGLHFSAPGVPDCYQGCELPDFSMVDPDNRRPVDFAMRQNELSENHSPQGKLQLISTLLRLRRDTPGLFAQGTYEPALASGDRSDHVLAFERRGEGAILRFACTLRCAAPLVETGRNTPGAEWWGDTKVSFASDKQPISAAALFGNSPVHAELIDSNSD